MKPGDRKIHDGVELIAVDSKLVPETDARNYVCRACFHNDECDLQSSAFSKQSVGDKCPSIFRLKS